MNAMNTMTKNEERPTLREVGTSELQAIVGGQVGGHGKGEQISFHPVPGYPTPWQPHAPIDPSPVLGAK
jgi:hypothetical protein